MIPPRIFDIFNNLQTKNIPFCFQCQSGNFYNLSVDDPKGKNHSFSSENINDIERFLNMMWGTFN